MKIRALLVSVSCGLALVAPPVTPNAALSGGVIPVAHAAGFSGLKDIALSPGGAVIYSLPEEVTSLTVTTGSDLASLSQTQKGNWRLQLSPTTRPGTYTLGIRAKIGDTVSDSTVRVTVGAYELNYKPETEIELFPGQKIRVAPTGLVPDGTEVDVGDTPMTVTTKDSGKEKGAIAVAVPPNAHPGHYDIPLTVRFPDTTVQTTILPLTVKKREIKFPTLLTINRGAKTTIKAGGYVAPWPSEATIRTGVSDRYMTATPHGSTVDISVADDAPLGEHTVTLFVDTPGQTTQISTVTIQVGPHQFFNFEDAFHVHAGAVLELQDLLLPEGAEVVRVQADTGIRVIHRPQQPITLQLGSNLAAGEYSIDFYIDYPGQDRVKKTMKLVVDAEDGSSTKPDEQPSPTKPGEKSGTTTDPGSRDGTKPTKPEEKPGPTPEPSPLPGAPAGACVAPPAGYAIPLAWALPLLALSAVHLPLPGLPEPIAQYQKNIGENVSGAIGIVTTLIAVVSAIGYGIGCYGQKTN